MPANRSRDRLRITHELRPHFEDAFTSIHLLPRGSGRGAGAQGHRSRDLDPWVKGPLLGLSKVPLHRRTPAASCPRRRPEGLPRSAIGSHSIRAFRPCRSSRLRRFAPHLSPRVFCTSQPIMGFARFWQTLRPCRFRIPRCVWFPRFSLLHKAVSSHGFTTSTGGRLDPWLSKQHRSHRRLAPSSVRSRGHHQPPDAPGGLHSPTSRRAGDGTENTATLQASLPSGAIPFKAFPSMTASPRHRGPCLLAVVHRRRFRLYAVIFCRIARPRGFDPSSSP
jgi:hypothetical protein